MQRCF